MYVRVYVGGRLAVVMMRVRAGLLRVRGHWRPTALPAAEQIGDHAMKIMANKTPTQVYVCRRVTTFGVFILLPLLARVSVRVWGWISIIFCGQCRNK